MRARLVPVVVVDAGSRHTEAVMSASGAGRLVLGGVAMLLSACSTAAGPDASRGPQGEGLAVTVAGLSLPEVDDVCVDLRVTNATGVVWQRGDTARTKLGADQVGDGPAGAADTETICSSRYGDAAANGLTYVGPCDASSDTGEREGVQNDVTLWVDGLYAGGVDVGDWQDPCPNGCTLEVDCVPNRDSLVRFDLAIMREARQGFFDVAVSFSDIFCSAKLDTCYPDGDDADELDDPIRLLHGAGEDRDWTAVFGLGCTAGPDASGTELMLGPLAVVCGDTSFVLDPLVPPGIHEVVAGGETLHVAVYRGQEALDCGFAPCRKVYWNLALSLDDLAATGETCTLDWLATARDPGDPERPFVDGVSTSPGLAYPYISVDATLTAPGGPICQRHPLNRPGSDVRTIYAGQAVGLGAATAMCARFDGVSAEAVPGEGCPDGPPPVVGGLSTPSAGTGDSLTFTGSGFGSAEGKVTFSGGAEADVQSWTPTAITVLVPDGGISGPVTIERADGTVVPDAPYFAYDDIEAPPLATLNATAYSIFDLDFDGLGNAYYAEFISGVDRMHRVAPNGTKTTYTGISDYNLGFGAASWDGSIVSGAYSGTTPRGVLLVDSNNVMQYLHAVAHNTCSTWNIDGYALCGPMDPEWGFDNWFYVGNLSGSGDVSRYNLTTKEVIVTLPAFVVSIATTSDLRLWAAAGNKLYSIDRVNGTYSEVATLGSAIVSISASQLHQRVYVERVGGVIESVSYAGTVTPFLSGFTRPAFITVGPDFALYRIEGMVDDYSAITRHELPAP